MATVGSPQKGAALRNAGAQVSSARRSLNGDGPTNHPRFETFCSVHESCLHRSPRGVRSPKLQGVALVHAALECDRTKQQEKYGGAEPSSRAARFHVTLPQTPQHSKYCEFGRHALQDSVLTSGRSPPATAGEGGGEHMGDTPRTTASLNAQENRPLSSGGTIRFNMNRLSKWFRDIDVNQTGSITQRELIVALRRHRGLQAMFCMMHGLEYGDAHTGSGEAATKARRDEVHRIKAIFREIDDDGSGIMEEAEFVEFFRRAGLLLEYGAPPPKNCR